MHRRRHLFVRLQWSRFHSRRISWPKTKLQNVGAATQPSTDITVSGNKVECVESFVYLGSAQSSDGLIFS